MAWGSRGDDWNWANGWILQAPEIQTMYSLNIPVPQLRTKMRQEFERHRYVNQMGVVDMLLFQSHAEFQVRGALLIWEYLVLGDAIGGSRCYCNSSQRNLDSNI